MTLLITVGVQHFVGHTCTGQIFHNAQLDPVGNNPPPAEALNSVIARLARQLQDQAAELGWLTPRTRP